MDAGFLRTVSVLARIIEHACPDLSPSAYRILAMVAEGEQRSSQLAVRLTLAKPTVSATVDALVEKGLVERSEVEGDRRAVNLRITAKGRAAVKAAEAAMSARIEPILARLDDPDEPVRTMAKVQRAIGEIVAERVAARA